VTDPTDEATPEATAERRRPRFFYGWTIVASSVATNTLLSAAYFQGFSVLFLPIESTFGWPRWVISAAFSMRQLESGVASPFIGFMLTRITARSMILWSGILTGLGLIGLGMINGLFSFFLFFFIVSLGASGASHAVTWPVLIARWFRRKRGMAMGFAVMGPIFGSPFLLINTSLEETFGWRAVLIGYGVVVIVGISLISMLISNTPEENGLHPDGDEPKDEAESAAMRSRTQADSGLTVRDVLHTREFWLLVAYMGGMFIVNSGIHGHQIPYLILDRGFSATEAAFSVTLVFLFSAAGRMGGGIIMDRSDYRFVLAVMAAVMGFSILYLQLTEPSTVFGAMPFIVMFGVGFGSMIPIRGTLGSMMFGLRSLGPVIGMMQGGAVAAGVFGPIYLGVMFDVNGTYREAMWGLVIISFVMAPMAFLMASPKYLRERKAQAGEDALAAADTGKPE
jgi:sugar phosphate permease